MEKLLSLGAIAFFAMAAVSLASSDKENIIAAEKNAWQTIKDKNFDAFQKILAADFRGVYSSGINSTAKEMDEVRTLDFKSFTFGEMDVVFIDKDAALVTYQVTVEGTANGKAMPGKMNAASVWKKEGSDWHVVFHTDVKAE